jgi:MFS family permease
MRGTIGSDNARPTRELITLVVLTMIALGYSLQQSLIVPALTTIQRELGASEITTTWLVTGFLLASSVATPIIGRLGDMYGRKRVMLLSLVVLAFGTALAGVATSIGVLLAARILQGLAGAIVPLSFGIVRDEMPNSRVPGSIGIISAMLAVGAALGIVFSGPIVTGLGVKWLFWLPMVTLVPTIIATWRYIPPSDTGVREPVDMLGGLLLTAWLVCLLVAVSQASSWGWLGGRTIALFGASLASFVLWIAAELRCAIPLVDVRLLRERTVATVNVISFTAGFTMQSLFTFVTRFVQLPEATGFGLGVRGSRAGLIVLPWSVGAFLTGLVSGRLAARFGSRRALVIGSIVSLLPSLLLAYANNSLVWIGVAMGATGVGTGFITAAMPAILVNYVPAAQTGVAAGMNQNIRTIGGAVGTQVVAAIIASSAVPKESLYAAAFLTVGGVCVLGVFAAFAVPGTPQRSASPSEPPPPRSRASVSQVHPGK